MSSNVIGVDMGGTKILSAVIDADGNILGTAKVPTKANRGVSEVIDRIGDSIRKAIDKSGVASESIQAVGSRTAMTKQFQKAIKKKGKKSVISKLTDGDLSAIRSGVLAKAIRANDKLTLKIFKKATKYLGIGIGSIVNFLNPEMIILGGGVVEALDDTFLDNIRAAAGKYALPNTLDGVQIVRAKLGDNSGILGAAALARHRFFNA